MGFALTIVYVALTIISPDQFGPEWAHYHALLYLAGLTLIFSLPNMLGNLRARSSIQTYLLLGFVLAVALSQVANGWFGGVLESWTQFLPSAIVFFFVVANVTTTRRLKILTLAAVASCLVMVVEALCGYYGGFRGETFVLQQSLYNSHDQVVGQIARVRGAGFLSDPNDFAQILLIALPLIFVAWRRRRVLPNVLFVLVPAVVMLWAVYLTHSRGALLALAVLAVMVARKRIGTTASVVLTTLLILGMLALDFTGGRAISAVEGADRLESWATGLELFKSAPLFGIGFGGYTDFNDITAHNSLVLCLAELGLLGATLWVALLVTTMTGLNKIIRLQRKGQKQPFLARRAALQEEISNAEVTPFAHESRSAIATVIATDKKIATRSEPAFQAVVPPHWVVAMRLALVAFIVTGWFLSRGYDTPLFLILGLATATITLQGHAATSRARSRWLSHTLVVETVAIIFIYGIVRFRP